MSDLVAVRRALISVSDKTDLIPFASALAAHGVEIISTGGTARALAEASIPVTPIDKLTGFPEIMGGRVKTLHPMVHGGLLAVRDDPTHLQQMADHGIKPIDLVCINLYPFEKTIAHPGVPEAEAVEQIDIGGPSMLRSAAKNFEWVTVVPSPSKYDRVIAELNDNRGSTTRRLRSELAAATFSRTAEYDAAIASFLGRTPPEAFPQVLRLGYVKLEDLRYGENPHQSAALYRDPAGTGPSIVTARQLHGKQLSYNNINDAAAALELVKTLHAIDPARTAAAIVKHANPCGCAVASSALAAVDRAIAGDPLAAYGGILALTATLDLPTAQRLCQKDVFLEVIVAPDFDPAAVDMLANRWAVVRLLAVGSSPGSPTRKLEYRSVPGGMLVQDRDVKLPEPEAWKHAAGPAPTPELLRQAAFLEVVVRSLSSNAVCLGGIEPGAHGPDAAVRLFGAGAGQMDRVAACKIAVAKAGTLARGSIAASDAFFPFADGPTELINAGVTCIVHPGGSKRDQDTIDLCNARSVTCLLTGIRRFRH